MGLREIKDRARRALHQAMQVPAYYYAPKTLVPVPCNIRVHNKWDGVGDVQGTSFRFAERRDTTNEIVFLRDEMPEPVNQAVVVISATEGYRVNTLDTPYLQTQTAFVTPLNAVDLKKYRGPDAGLIAAGAIVAPFISGAPTDDSTPYFDVTGSLALFLMLSGSIVAPYAE